MRSAAPTAAQRRALAELVSPKPKRGAPLVPTGCMVVPVPKGYASMTREQRLVAWEALAAPHCAALMEATRQGMDQPVVKTAPAL